MTVIHSCPSCEWSYRGKGHTDRMADLKFEEHWKQEHGRKGRKHEANAHATETPRGEP